MICVNSVSVSPSSVTLQTGKWYYGIKATVCPTNADCKSVRWHSDNTNVATVNATSGYIYARVAGTARIYATATDGSGKSDYITVTVSNTVPVTSVTLNKESVSLEKGDCTTLMAAVSPANATNKTLNWTSSKPSVASVQSNGVVCALDGGSAVITATAKDGSGACDCCTVTVTEDILVTSVTVSPSQKTMTVGDSVFLHETVCPANATNKSVLWSSSNADVAFVNYSSGLVTAKSAGTAVIYATATDGSGVKGSCTVTVENPILVESVTVCPATLTMNVNETVGLSATVYPANATRKTLRWSSDDDSIAEVDSATGCVTAKGTGTTTVYATARDGSCKEGACIVTVQTVPAEAITISAESVTIGIGETYELSAAVMPANATNQSIQWESENERIATVDRYTGEVTAVSGGETRIKATAVGGNCSVYCLVTVDPRAKVMIERDWNYSLGDRSYFNIVFPNGKIWRNIGCDLTLDENRSGEELWNVEDNYAAFTDPEKRYVDNIEQTFSAQELALIYRFDPLGIEYYMKNDACNNMTLSEGLFFKDDVYKAIFGDPPSDRFYFTVDDSDADSDIRHVFYGTYAGWDRADVYSNAETLFGSHVIFDWSKFWQSILTTLFEAIPGVSYIQTGVEIYQALFHTGSFWGLYSDTAKSQVENYVTAPLDNLVKEKLGEKAHKCVGWANNLIAMLTDATVSAFVIPNINDITIYDTIEEQSDYRVVFENHDGTLSLQEIIDLCTD